MPASDPSETNPIDISPSIFVVLHDPQEIIDAFENNRTIVIESLYYPTGLGFNRQFPIAFDKNEEYSMISVTGDDFYYDSRCNYFCATH